MTVSDLIHAQEDLTKAIKDLDQLASALEANKDIESILSQTYNIKHAHFTINGAKNRLIEYQKLLKDITKETEIAWPPTCNITRP